MPSKTRRVALAQFDARPEDVGHNLNEIERLSRSAADAGARWIMFHEGTLCDYSPSPNKFAQAVPVGAAVKRVAALSKKLKRFISFGLTEKADGRCFITQAFCGPRGFIYSYRKTWLWREPSDEGYRNEWQRYDPGDGPKLFKFDGLSATCFICADGEAPRCIERAAGLRPQIVFFPNNRSGLPDFEVFGRRARQIGAPMLVTNRVGRSWSHACIGGCVVYSPRGKVLAAANRDGREEILIHDLHLD